MKSWLWKLNDFLYYLCVYLFYLCYFICYSAGLVIVLQDLHVIYPLLPCGYIPEASSVFFSFAPTELLAASGTHDLQTRIQDFSKGGWGWRLRKNSEIKKIGLLQFTSYAWNCPWFSVVNLPLICSAVLLLLIAWWTKKRKKITTEAVEAKGIIDVKMPVSACACLPPIVIFSSRFVSLLTISGLWRQLSISCISGWTML